MRPLIAVLVVLVSSSICWGIGYWEFFDYPDGGFPWLVLSTGCPQGEGSFAVYDSTFVHVSGGPVYYVIPVDAGWQRMVDVQMRVRGSGWVFAWKISLWPGSSGRCLWLSHDDLWGGWGYTLGESEWHNADADTCADALLMWHNGQPVQTVHEPTAGPLSGWHEVMIWDNQSRVLVYVDYELVFDASHSPLWDGCLGLGCTGEGEMAPAFDYVMVDWADAVKPSSWGQIKALYR
jgi:hypothetical protein